MGSDNEENPEIVTEKAFIKYVRKYLGQVQNYEFYFFPYIIYSDHY